jgi:hypothetical protein
LIHSCRGEHTEAVSSIGVSGLKDGFASIARDATALRDFLPLPAAPSFLAAQQSLSRAVLRFASALGCAGDRL